MQLHADLSGPIIQCSEDAVKDFVKRANANLLLSNALMVASAVLVAIMVAVGASGRRYRHATVTRFVFQGASTLYLPIVSFVVSSIAKDEHFGSCTSGLDVECHGRSHLAMLLIWTVLVQIVGTNTSAIVAAADGGGDHKLGPSIELLTRMVWTSYLVLYYTRHGFLPAEITREDEYYMLVVGLYYSLASQFLVVLCFLALAKLTLKFYAFQKARQSFALGRNSRLITGYIEELLADESRCRSSVVPPLIVMGEDQQEIEETPHGYTIKQRTTSGTLVTLDMVWALASVDDTLMATRPWLKDLCLSFALFKLLRRQFAVTHLVESAKAFSFVLDVLLNSSSPDPERVFKVIADEISFVLDSYYSSLPTSNFGRLLPFLNIVVSLSIISWCLFGCAIARIYSIHHPRQLFCTPTPVSCTIPPHYLIDDIAKGGTTVRRAAFGNIIFDILPTVSLFLVVIVAEAWEIISYLCSSWIKVTLLCSYITQPSWRRSPRLQMWLGRVLELKINFRRSWNDRMGQIQLLPPLPAPRHRRHALTSHCLFLLFSSDPRIKHVQVPLVVKAAILDALRSSNGRLSKGTAALRRSRIGHRLLWACQARGTSDVILAWHISTGVFDFEASHGGASVASSSNNRTVATRLSRYCVYLMAAHPELLPDDWEWSKKLFDAVSGDIKRALAGDGQAEHEGMAVALLNERSEHEVVKRGLKLGKQLLDLARDEEDGWALLASFWSEMLLFVAPTDSLRAPHKKAIAGGTELLTLVWALLTHTGIFNRTTIRTAV